MKDPDPTKYELDWSAKGIDNPNIEAALKSAIVAGLDAELAKGTSPRTPTGFPREIKINVHIVWPPIGQFRPGP